MTALMIKLIKSVKQMFLLNFGNLLFMIICLHDSGSLINNSKIFSLMVILQI